MVDIGLDIDLFKVTKPNKFGCPSAHQHINKESLMTLKNLKELKTKVLLPLNNMFPNGEDPLVVCETPLYVILRCKYQGCEYRYWYNKKEIKNPKHK